MEKKFEFRLYSTCIPVKGCLRSIIYDLERNRFDFIPNGLYKIVTAEESQKHEILKEVPDEILNDYQNFLKEKDYLLSVGSMQKYFPGLSLEWDFPARISNALVELSDQTSNSFEKVAIQLDLLGCHYYQIMVVDEITVTALMKFLDVFKNKSIREIQLIVDFKLLNNASFIEEVPLKYPFCNRILIFNAPYSKLNEKDYYVIEYVKGEIHQRPGDPRVFNVNLRLFAESQHYNTFFNRKIIIDQAGRIVPFLGSSKSFGYLDDELFEIIEMKGFKKLWGRKKDNIKICKDCEFRYMCVDSRVPVDSVEGEDEDYYFKSSCSYDPYTAKWP